MGVSSHEIQFPLLPKHLQSGSHLKPPDSISHLSAFIVREYGNGTSLRLGKLNLAGVTSIREEWN